MSNTQWKEFKIGDLFEIKVGKQPPIGNRHDTKEEGFVNTITGVTLNNGVGFYSKPYSDIYINELTMAKDGEYAGKVFLQRDEFCLGGHSLGLLMGSDVSNDSKLYLATLLNGLQSKGQWQNSTYINSVTLKELKEILIPLPVTAEGTPDWTYMEAQIIDKQEQVNRRLEQLTGTQEAEKVLVYNDNINTGEVLWKEFILGDLFEVTMGKFIPKKDLGGEYNYITTSAFNNGVTGTIGGAEHRGNKITVASDGSIGASFYQEEPFSTSNIVATLTPLDDIPLNKDNAQFLCTLIRTYAIKYNYGKKFSANRIRKAKIPFPSTTEGTPDWSYMEEYIKEKQEVVSKRLGMLTKTRESRKTVLYGISDSTNSGLTLRV